MSNAQYIADQLLRGAGAVGDPSVRPYNALSGMGAPVQMMDQPGAGAPPVQYTSQAYVAGDVSWFGFGHTVVPSGSTGTVVPLTPKRPLAPQKLFCPSNVQNLELTSADIAGTNLFASGLGIPIELFSEVSTSPQISWPTIDTNTGIDFTLVNTITAGNKNFRGAFYCTALRR
jgi:hypothetical protein